MRVISSLKNKIITTISDIKSEIEEYRKLYKFITSLDKIKKGED